jgi:F0F1-type ATP synthase epsilon subunit
LPEHTNFITLVKEFIRLEKLDGTKQKFDIDTGIVKVTTNDVRIYLGVFSSAIHK